MAIDEGLKSPIFGIGFLSLRNVFVARIGGSDNNAHNSFLTLFAELGIVGFVMYFAVMVSIIRFGLRLYRQGTHSQDRLRGAAVLAMVAAYLIPGFFSNTLLGLTDFSTLYMFVFLGGIVGLYNQPGLVRDSTQFPHTLLQRKSQTYAGL